MQSAAVVISTLSVKVNCYKVTGTSGVLYLILHLYIFQLYTKA